MTIKSDYKNIPIPASLHSLFKAKTAQEGKSMQLVLVRFMRMYLKDGENMAGINKAEPDTDNKNFIVEWVEGGTKKRHMKLEFKNPVPKAKEKDYRVSILFNLSTFLIEKLIEFVGELPTESRIPKSVKNECDPESYADWYARDFGDYIKRILVDEGEGTF